MLDIYLAQVVCEPGLYIANFDSAKQLVTEAMLSLNQTACQEWVAKQKGKHRVKKSRVSKLNLKKIKSMYLYEDRRELSITVEMPGSLMRDFKPKAFFLSIRGEDLTPEMERVAKQFIWEAECKRQREWKKKQRAT